MTGSGTESQSQISGSSSTTFYNLVVNKNSNNANLGQIVTLNNQLTLTAGKLALRNYNLKYCKKSFSNGEKISSLFDELFLIEYELKKAWCSGLHAVFFKEVVD